MLVDLWAIFAMLKQNLFCDLKPDNQNYFVGSINKKVHLI